MGNITHAKVSTISDGDDDSLVKPSDWNADHSVTAPVTDHDVATKEYVDDADDAIDTAIAVHAAIEAADATLGHVIVESGSLIDVDGDGKLTLGAHATTHQNGGSDEVQVDGLSGLLADDQHVLDAEVLLVAAALVHASRHQDGGADEISLTSLSGDPADTINESLLTTQDDIIVRGTSIAERLNIAASRIVGKASTGNVAALTPAQVKTILGAGVASGLATLNASVKVVEQPASITDHLENPPTEDLATKAPTSEWAYDLKDRMIDGPLSPGVITGGVISEGTVGTITISAITALLRTGTEETDPLVYVTLAEQANQTMVAADTLYHVGLDYNSGSPQVLIQVANFNRTTEIGLGICMKDTSDPIKVHFMNSGMRHGDGVSKLQRRASSLRSTELASGCAIGDVGGATKQFNIQNGVVYHGIHRLTPFADAPYNPFISGDDKFTYVYGDTTAGFTFSDGTDTIIDNVQFWNTATHALDNVGVTHYGCHWVYIHPDEQHVYVVLGTTDGKLAEAEQAQPLTDLPMEIGDFGLLLGCIIILRDATAFTTIQMVTDTFFTGSAVADHGSLAGLDGDDHPQYTLKSLFDAYTLLMATVDNTPIALTVGASRIVGRKSTGAIVALTGAELMAILSGQAGADFAMNTHKITGVVDPTADQHAATKKYVDDNIPASSLFVDNPDYDSVLDIFSNDPACGWTTIDANAIVGNNAKFVILQFRFQAGVCGTAGTSHLALRKDALSTGVYVCVVWHNNPDPTEKRGIAIIGLTDSQTFQYTIGEATGASGFYIDLNVQGWIE